MRKFGFWLLVIVLALFTASSSRAQLSAADKQLAHDIFKQLIEINTTHSSGSTTLAAQAMAKRLRDAGFPGSDMVVMGPDPRHGNLVLRYPKSPDPEKMKKDLERLLKYSRIG